MAATAETEAETDAEMREDEVLACAFGAWYPRFRSVTYKSEVISLPEPFVEYLLADGINVGAGGADDSSSDSSGWGEGGDGEGSEAGSGGVAEIDFPELEERISAAIASLGGGVLPKLNWSAPKDAQWLQPSLQCRTAREVITLLKASDFVAHDLCHSFDHCSTSRRRPDEFTLVLRRWHDLHESSEFRCFVSDSAMFAISQRNSDGFFEHLCEKEEAEALRKTIRSFFEQHIRAAFPLRRYVFDVYVCAAPKRKVRLVDFSPWGPTTDACLYDWPELKDLAVAAAAAAESEAPLEFRVVHDDSERQSKAERFHNIPVELAQVSGGQGLEDFIRKADRLLEEKRRKGDPA